jgi:integrase/recombinase XerD
MKNTCHKSTNTVESYTRDVTQYITYLIKSGVTDLAGTTKTTVLSYMLDLKKKGRASSTLSRTLASIRSFYVFLINDGLITKNPTDSLATPKIEKKPPKVLSNADVDKLLSQPKLTDNKGIRDKAMLELLYATGIRVSELINLNIDDINLNMGYIRCENSKGERVIPVGYKAITALTLYIETARNEMVSDISETALFVNCSGGRISRQGFWKIIKLYQNMSGIEEEITPHSLRHSFAAHLIENGADLMSLKTMMGHTDISSTKVYTCFLDEKIRNVYEKAHPRA